MNYSIERDLHNEIFYGWDRNYDMFLSPSGSDFVPRLGAGLVCETRDRVLNPHMRVYQELGMVQNGGALGCDPDYRE